MLFIILEFVFVLLSMDNIQIQPFQALLLPILHQSFKKPIEQSLMYLQKIRFLEIDRVTANKLVLEGFHPTIFVQQEATRLNFLPWMIYKKLYAVLQMDGEDVPFVVSVCQPYGNVKFCCAGLIPYEISSTVLN